MQFISRQLVVRGAMTLENSVLLNWQTKSNCRILQVKKTIRGTMQISRILVILTTAKISLLLTYLRVPQYFCNNQKILRNVRTHWQRKFMSGSYVHPHCIQNQEGTYK